MRNLFPALDYLVIIVIEVLQRAYTMGDWVIQLLWRHPLLVSGISMCVLSFALPFIIFMVFATVTVIIPGKSLIHFRQYFPTAARITCCSLNNSLNAIFIQTNRHIDNTGIGIWILQFSHNLLLVLHSLDDGHLL